MRMALGARAADIIRDVLVRGGRFALIGIVIGVVLAGALAQLLRTLLVDVSPFDPLDLRGRGGAALDRLAAGLVRAGASRDRRRSAGRTPRRLAQPKPGRRCTYPTSDMVVSGGGVTAMTRHPLGFVVTVAVLGGMSALVGRRVLTRRRGRRGAIPISRAPTPTATRVRRRWSGPRSSRARRLEEITPEELSRLNQQRNQARTKADEARWELRSPLHWFENLDFRNSRAWMVTDPPDGRIPPLTPQARQRAAARAEARKGRGEADSYDRPQPLRSLHQPRHARAR